MSIRVCRLSSFVLLSICLSALSASDCLASDKVNTNFFGVAIKGYDPVAYFTEGRAVEGSNDFSYVWNDAKWHFTSAQNRDLFASEPERFAPQYGGY